MIMEIQIRDCMETDMQTITDIYAFYVLESVTTFELIPPDVNEMTKRRSDLLAKGFPYIVAEINGEVIGYAYIGNKHQKFINICYKLKIRIFQISLKRNVSF